MSETTTKSSSPPNIQARNTHHQQPNKMGPQAILRSSQTDFQGAECAMHYDMVRKFRKAMKARTTMVLAEGNDGVENTWCITDENEV
ncbi:hypothetical protein JHK82_016754 [Glycine max]|nr:hypothetical protein JHK82_016754 [Glycine max]